MGKLLIIGSLNMDTVVEAVRRPGPGETVLGRRYGNYPGGKGANQAYAAGRLGADARMIGCVGADSPGNELIRSLRSAGVDTRGILAKAGSATGSAFITVDDQGDNSIIVVPGANATLCREDIDHGEQLLDECDMVLLQLEIPLETVAYAADLAKRKGKTVILDPAPAVSDLPVGLLGCVDILKPNETELAILTGIPISGRDDEQVALAARQMLDTGVGAVVATLGDRGAMLVNADGWERFAAPEVDVVDTTAAGDTFTAALAVGLLGGASFRESVAFANVASAIAVTRKGAQPSIPSLEQVNQAMDEQTQIEWRVFR